MPVFDAEFDGLDPTKIHCLSYQAKGKVVSLTTYEQMRVWLMNQTQLIGHNIQRYDIPHLERLLGIKIECQLTDTLILSWYLFHGRVRHGLGEWGEEFGIPKPVVDDWEGLSLEEYVHRCEEDVKINQKLWSRIAQRLKRLYGEGEEYRLLDYLEFKMDCAREQERSRWKLDVDRCIAGLESLEADRDKRVIELRGVMPDVPTYRTVNPPANPYKMNGELSVHGQRWIDALVVAQLPLNHQESFKVVSGSKAPNPGSVPQIKDWLFSMGWEPKNFKHVREDDGTYRKIPQVKSAKESEGVCKSIKLLYTCEPSLAVLDGLAIISHRIGILKGFLNDVDDEGYIQAQIQGLTNTMRFKHKVVLNLPGADKPYGDLIRGVLIVPEGYELCGSDMCSLEDRTKQHYMWDYDPEYVKTMMEDNFDPHLDIAILGGAITQEQVDAYKAEVKEVVKRFKGIRHDYKQVNYSCTYGITPAGLTRAHGWPLEKSTRMREIYWQRNWSINSIADACVVKTCFGEKWLFNPISKLWYSLRTDKDRFSTLNQGTGVYCFDTWIRNFRKKRNQLTGQMHDEVMLCIKKGHREQCIRLLKEAIKETNEELGLNRDLDVSIQFGSDYSKIH